MDRVDAGTRNKTKAVLDLLAETGISWTPLEICDRLGIKKKEIYDIIRRQVRFRRIKQTYRISDGRS